MTENGFGTGGAVRLVANRLVDLGEILVIAKILIAGVNKQLSCRQSG
jgi:hypothetical protein